MYCSTQKHCRVYSNISQVDVFVICAFVADLCGMRSKITKPPTYLGSHALERKLASHYFL